VGKLREKKNKDLKMNSKGEKTGKGWGTIKSYEKERGRI